MQFETLSYQELVKIEGKLQEAKEVARNRELARIADEAKSIGLTLADLRRTGRRKREARWSPTTSKIARW